jgi:hypothetical protein
VTSALIASFDEPHTQGPQTAFEKPVLVLLSRPLCHLCDDMEKALIPLANARGLDLNVMDIDDHPELEARFGREIPVILWKGECIYAGPLRGEALQWALDRWHCTAS